MLDRYVAMDLETTGLNPDYDKIIEVGLIKVYNGEVVDSLHSFVMPGKKLPLRIKKLTGIEDEMLEGAPTIGRLKKDLYSFIEGEKILGHNIGFDISFIERSLGETIHNRCFDTYELARILIPTTNSYRLTELCSLFGYKSTFHRAIEDAKAVFHLYDYLSKCMSRLDGHTRAYLSSLFEKAGSPWSGVVSGFNGSRYDYSALTKNSTFSEEKKVDYIHKNTGARGYVNPDEIRGILSDGGILAAKMPHYESRPGQVEMAEEVAGAFNKEKILMVEAGTGTGKSIAYLVPSLLWAAGGGQKVVISTKTINLQDQLWYRDIPFLKDYLGINVKTALAKGRSNYICFRKWMSILSGGEWSGQEAIFYARVLVWVSETKSGDKIELNLNSQEEEIWANICAENDSCMGTMCRYFPNRCFYARARQEAETAGIIITNHALLFSDIKTGNMVLPAYGPLIIDEAHHLEDAATEQLGKHASRSDVRRWLNSINRLVFKYWGIVPPSDQDVWMKLLVSLRDEVNIMRSVSEEFFSLIKNYIYREKNSGEGETQNYRIKKDFLYSDETGLPWGELGNLVFRAKSVQDYLRSTLNLMNSWSVENDSWAEKVMDFIHIVSAGEEIVDAMEFMHRCDDDSFVYWTNVSGQGEWSSVSLNASPIRVGPLLYDKLFSEAGPVVMTSATLTINGSFDYFAERTGVDRISGSRVIKKDIESPFIYEDQSLLCVVKNLPLQGPEADSNYLKATGGAIESLINTVGGKTLVLFTSHRVLREVYGFLKTSLEEKDISLFGHNIDGNRSRIVEEFMRLEKAVLMGAASFWEGVDIPGESLTSVIIVKLPFPSPASPVIAARMEDMEIHGRSSFYDYYLPTAVIKFKQGFGRLIRTETDRGVVVVLDRRIVEKGYGKHFLGSLPLKNYYKGDFQNINKKIKDWVERNSFKIFTNPDG
ncbi:MAG: helicase C-terminal domain-containing protein [Bacillota bacterium]